MVLGPKLIFVLLDLILSCKSVVVKRKVNTQITSKQLLSKKNDTYLDQIKSLNFILLQKDKIRQNAENMRKMEKNNFKILFSMSESSLTTYYPLTLC